jgi:hypothetical protein
MQTHKRWQKQLGVTTTGIDHNVMEKFNILITKKPGKMDLHFLNLIDAIHQMVSTKYTQGVSNLQTQDSLQS